MKALITGVQGFVGKYLANHLLSQGIEVWGTSREESPLLCLANGNVKIVKNDLNDEETIYSLLQTVKPDYIFHLAGQSNVKKSWEDKEGTFYANVNKTIFLLDACVRYQQENPQIRLLTVGSSEEYGRVEPHELPIKETTPLRPMSPYGASKAAVSMLIQQYHKAHGLNVIHARPFNHIGAEQLEGFVVPDFITQIKKIRDVGKDTQIAVGNLTPVRDFLNVKDVVAAYYILLQRDYFGEVFNVSSNQGISIRELVDIMIEYSGLNIQVKVDPNKLRKVDTPILLGDNSKIISKTEWRPLNKIKETIGWLMD